MPLECKILHTTNFNSQSNNLCGNGKFGFSITGIKHYNHCIIFASVLPVMNYATSFNKSLSLMKITICSILVYNCKSTPKHNTTVDDLMKMGIGDCMWWENILIYRYYRPSYRIVWKRTSIPCRRGLNKFNGRNSRILKFRFLHHNTQQKASYKYIRNVRFQFNSKTN